MCLPVRTLPDSLNKSLYVVCSGPRLLRQTPVGSPRQSALGCSDVRCAAQSPASGSGENTDQFIEKFPPGLNI